MRPPFKKLLQASALTTGAIALVVSSAGVAGATQGEAVEEASPGNSAAELVLSPNGCTLDVTSDKDISNVKLYDESGMFEEIEGPSTTSFDVTGATEVSIKSGTTEERASITCTPEELDEVEEPDDTTPTPVEDIDDDEIEEEGDAGDDAIVSASLECGDLTVSSTKELSNIVVVFADGTEQKFDNLSDEELTFLDEQLDDGEITGVFIKSGNNSDDTDERNSTGEFVTVTESGVDCEPENGNGPAPIVEIDDEDQDDVVDEDDNVDDDDDDNDNDGVDEDVLGDGNTPEVEETPEVDVEGDEILRTVTPVVPVAMPTAIPATPVQPQAVLASNGNRAPQVLGSQVTRSPGALAATGAGTNLVPFGLGLVLLGFAIQRKSKALSAARVR